MAETGTTALGATAPAEREVLVRAAGLHREFRGRPAVQDVSLTLRAGEVTGFLGANGAGKTTTLRMMLGLISGAGATEFLGRPLREWNSPASVVGVVLGGVAGHPGHTVRAHLRMVAAGAGVPDRRVAEVLAAVGLTEAGGKRLRTLSLGMSQRVGIAQALLADPPVLILDEPANGLDPHSIRWLRGMLRALAAEGRAVLVSSHLLAEMEQLADRVVVLARGRVAAEVSVAELGQYAHGRVTVQSPHVEKLAGPVRALGATYENAEPGSAVVTGLTRFQVGDLAAGHGVTLHWLDERPPSLEDFYLSVAEEEFRIS
jgi:ABC-2 type transport system ATP-binding protein